MVRPIGTRSISIRTWVSSSSISWSRVRNQSDLDVGLFDFASGDRDLFGMKRNPQIFWLPLLIGHALLSNHGSEQGMPWRLWSTFRNVRVKYPRISGRLAAVPLGRSLINKRCWLRFLVDWTGSRFLT